MFTYTYPSAEGVARGAPVARDLSDEGRRQGDEEDADDGSAFGDDDVVPPPPPPLPSELSTGRPEPSVPRPPRTEEYFGANVYDRSPRPDEPGGRLFI